MSKPIYDAKGEMELMSYLWSKDIADDPEAFVMFSFPWGKPGTPLEHQSGPRRWQRRQLRAIAGHIKAGRNLQAQKKIATMYRKAIASGRGIGKSAVVAWLILWFMSTRLGGTCIVTANTEQQLKSRTWAELGKWVTMAINAHWWEYTATSLRPAKWFEESLKRDLKVDTGYYYAQAQLWSEDNPDAFAGAHNHAGIMLLMDEASGIPPAIFGVSEGFFTEPVLDRFWFCFSNPRRTSGPFFECFHKNRDLWNPEKVDARSVEGTDPATYEAIIQQHGKDSYEAFVEVYGDFPSASPNQFIPSDTARAAQERETPRHDAGAPLVLGVDVARSGEDKSVIAFRRGRDARSIPWVAVSEPDTMIFARQVMDAADKYSPDAIFIDGGGVGGPLVDLLKAAGYKVREVQFGAGAEEKDRYSNKRTEMWSRMKEWLLIGSIPNDDQLFDDLKGVEKKPNPVTNQMGLESKDQMKRRGLASPDRGDALAMTFAQNVSRRDTPTSRGHRRVRTAVGIDYAMFG